MKAFMQHAGNEIWKTVAYAILTIGAPITLLMIKYELYQTNIDKLAIAGIIIVLLIGFFALHLFNSAVANMKLTYRKKIMWGIIRVFPLLLVLMTAYWLSANIEFVKQMLYWTIGTNTVAFMFAPDYVVVPKHEGKGD